MLAIYSAVLVAAVFVKFLTLIAVLMLAMMLAVTMLPPVLNVPVPFVSTALLEILDQRRATKTCLEPRHHALLQGALKYTLLQQLPFGNVASATPYF